MRTSLFCAHILFPTLVLLNIPLTDQWFSSLTFPLNFKSSFLFPSLSFWGQTISWLPLVHSVRAFDSVSTQETAELSLGNMLIGESGSSQIFIKADVEKLFANYFHRSSRINL